MKKGFTLIELLAVIVILAIIALIATPLIMNVIDEAKRGSFENSAYGIVRAAEITLATDILSGNNNEVIITYNNGQESSSNGKKLEYKGEKPKNGKIKINKNGEIAIVLHNGSHCAIKPYHLSKITVEKMDKKDCEFEKLIDDSGANAPILVTGMTPIKWDGSEWVTTTVDDPEWYDYANKKWANVRTEDGSYWVWIPRYGYKITSCFHSNCSGGAGNIEIKFLIGTTNKAADGSVVETSGYNFGTKDTSTHYFLHPAFTFGNDEIPGFWVAKFEPSGSSSNINIVPNATSLRNMKIGEQFDAAFNMRNNSKYGWSSTEVDTHMMKNTEWGAVAYLSKSEYGANEEIWINNSSTFITGCAGDSVSDGSYSGCQNAYNTATGQKASTTHNIYGVYDMSGGAYEYVAAYVDNGHSNLTTYGQSIINADIKYKDVYTIGASDSQANNYEANKNKYGDAVHETSSSYESSNSWYGDYSYMPFSSFPWFLRGGYYDDGADAGAFNFGSGNGNAFSYSSFRPVVAPLAPSAP